MITIIILILGYVEGVGSSAVFRRILSLVQLNATHYIVTDFSNHCLRQVQYVNNQWETSTYAGDCTNSGSKDGQLLNAKLNEPVSMIKLNETLILSEGEGKAIKQINISAGTVTTIYKSSHEIFHLAFDDSSNSFYATTFNGILTITDEQQAFLTGTTSSGNRAASFSRSRFSIPTDIKWIDNVTLLVTDYSNHVLKVVDMAAQRVYKICVGKSVEANGARICLCFLFYANSNLDSASSWFDSCIENKWLILFYFCICSSILPIIIAYLFSSQYLKNTITKDCINK